MELTAIIIQKLCLTDNRKCLLGKFIYNILFTKLGYALYSL